MKMFPVEKDNGRKKEFETGHIKVCLFVFVILSSSAIRSLPFPFGCRFMFEGGKEKERLIESLHGSTGNSIK